MLTAHQHHKLEDCSSHEVEGWTTWRVVNLELGIPYAFITYSNKQNSHWLYQTSIFWIEEDILEFCRLLTHDKTRKITELSLLLPSLEVGASGKRWVPIKELWSRNLPTSSERYLVYISMQNDSIGEINETAARPTVRNSELLYRNKKEPRIRSS